MRLNLWASPPHWPLSSHNVQIPALHVRERKKHLLDINFVQSRHHPSYSHIAMSAIGSLVFCTDCGTLLDSNSEDNNAILLCDVCGARCKGLSPSPKLFSFLQDCNRTVPSDPWTYLDPFTFCLSLLTSITDKFCPQILQPNP